MSPSAPLNNKIATSIDLTTKYVIVTSVRDEESFVQQTLDSVINQTIRPVEWVVVNDGSTDRTGIIVDQYAAHYPWIRALHRSNRGFRSAGGGIDGFLYGYESLDCKDWEFLVNLDGDLTLVPGYFEKCFAYFRENPRLGIGGGTIYNKIGDELQVERGPDFHVRGATKIYRRQCWEGLGGMLRGLGWDTVDEVKANMRGWSTQSFPDLQLIHHRVTGTAQGLWWGLLKDGQAAYIVGYHPLFFAAKCVCRAFRSPYLIGAVGLGYGFLRGYLKHTPRVEDREFIRYLRHQQMSRLLRRETIWR
jgi:glycosyltransferase involved in cell wall biosynthesis